jgi:hypothetical protein
MALVSETENRARTMPLVALGAGGLVSFLVLTVAAWQRSFWGVAIGAVLLGVISVRLNRTLRHTGSRLSKVFRLHIPVLITTTGIAVLVAWFLDSGQLTEGWGFFGSCLLLVGIGQLLSYWRHRDGWRWRCLLLIPAGVLACVVGLYTIDQGAGRWPSLLLAGGLLLLVPVSLSLLTEDALRWLRHRQQDHRTAWLLASCGLLAAVLGIVWLAAVLGLPVWYVTIAGFGLIILVGAIASDTPADLIILASVAAVVWSIIPRGVEQNEAVTPKPGSDVMVAMGDSFMSGEGAKRFFDGTNDKGANECRRAPTAYPSVAVSRHDPAIPGRLLFVACSGARAADIYRQTQSPGDPVGGPPGGLNQLDHVAWIRATVDVNVKVVVVSIGGNDALFGEIGRVCVGPGDCTEYGGRWLDHLANVAPMVYQAYQRIRESFGSSVPVVVVPYPIPISQWTCGSSPLTDREHRFLYGFTAELNKVLSRAARDAGFHYLAEMESVFENRRMRICDEGSKAGVNFLDMNSVSGLVEQSVNPQNWFHNSLHPNERGHQAMADTLSDWLRHHPDLAVLPEPPVDQGLSRIATVEEIMGDRLFPHCGSDRTLPHCAGSAQNWARGHLIRVAWHSVVPLGLLIGGAWLLSVGVLWYRRQRAVPAREPAGPPEPQPVPAGAAR